MNKCHNHVVNNILKNAESEMFNLRHPYVGTEHLLLSLLKTKKVKDICTKYNLTYNSFKKELLEIVGSASKKSETVLYTPLLKLIISKAYDYSLESNKELDELILFETLINETDGIALKIIDNMGIDINIISKEIKTPKLVYEFGINLNEKLDDDKILLREKEMLDIMEILLRRKKNNPLLIGKAGVGKTAIVEELAKRIKKGNVPDALKSKEIILINSSTLIAGTKYRGEFEERVNNLIKEVINNKNILLFIDEIHNIVKTGSSDGSIDAGNILKPYLARGDLSVIGATTTEEYNSSIKKDAALTRRFATITINEPSLKDMEYILMKVKTNFEKHYDLKINASTIRSLIKLCDIYLPNLYNPDKCIDILDTVCSKKTLERFNNVENNIITKKDIESVIYSRTNIFNIENERFELIKNKLSEKYNEEIIRNIINIIKAKKQNKHMVLYGEDKGVKEDILNTISSELNINLIDINCIEYNDEYSLNKLLANDYLYNEINENPHSIILFKNFEEAGRVIYNIIQTMINDGYITNSKNEKLLLNNTTIFIMDNTNKCNIGFTKEKDLLFAK